MNPNFLFLKSEFLDWQGEHQLIRDGQISLPFFLKDGFALAPLGAPFGGFQCKGMVSESEFARFLKVLPAELRRFRATGLRLVLPPDAYQPEWHLWLLPLLKEAGFKVIWQDLNFHLETGSSFTSRLHRSERWKRNKSIREGYFFTKVETPNWDLLYPFLLESRKRKGYFLSMSREALETTVRQFPAHYRISAVWKEDHLAALGVTIKVSPEIEYVFYTADALAHRKVSPVVLLHEGIYNSYAEKATPGILDLGTASLRGIVNSGVATFKRNLGGIASVKTTLQLTL
jgi:hypothetical protein